MSRRIVVSMIVLCLGVAPVMAAQTACLTDFILALSRAYAVCRDTDRNTLCYGGGGVQASFYQVFADGMFAQPGDLTDAGRIEALILGGTNPPGIVWLHLQANLSVQQEQAATLIAVGPAEMVNLVPPVPSLRVTASAAAIIRRAPDPTADILARAAVSATLFASGRTADSRWLRVGVPNSDDSGWVSVTTLATGDFTALNVVDSAELPARPFTAFQLQTSANETGCDGLTQGGLFIQTPNDHDVVVLGINGVTLRLTGTAFVTASPDALEIQTLEGTTFADSDGRSYTIPAGARLSGVDVVPYLPDSIPVSAMNFLDRRLMLVEPLSPAQIEAILNAAPPTAAPPVFTPTPAPVCERVLQAARNIRRGPGTDYPVVGTLAAQAFVDPIGQLITPTGSLWWKLGEGRWLLADTVRETGPCDLLPLTAFDILPSTNAITLETCLPENGPLRPGQRVTLTFTPDAWDTGQAANGAYRQDSGRIQVGDTQLPVQATNSIQVEGLGYIRHFSAQWVAQPGSYRIEGEQLSYRIICNVTVSSGR